MTFYLIIPRILPYVAKGPAKITKICEGAQKIFNLACNTVTSTGATPLFTSPADGWMMVNCPKLPLQIICYMKRDLKCDRTFTLTHPRLVIMRINI